MVQQVTPNGFHLLLPCPQRSPEPIFQFLSLTDSLELAPRQDGKIVGCYNIQGLKFKDDLIYKAALMLQKNSGTKLGVDIGLEKKIPVGGGLGGGSSNAATMLVALNEVWGLNYSLEKLMSIGATLGADVPVFIFGRAAWAEGRGEMLEPINLDEKVILLLFPGVSVSTKKIFSDPFLQRNTIPINKEDFGILKVRNDFQETTNKIYPEVKKALGWLTIQSEKAFMSGTGSTIFAVFDSYNEAKKVEKKVPQYWESTVTQCLNQSPLLNSLKAYQNMVS